MGISNLSVSGNEDAGKQNNAWINKTKRENMKG